MTQRTATTMNKWGIPPDLERAVIARDQTCVYCGVEFKKSSQTGDRKQTATWEHFDNDKWNDQSIMTINVARCCNACNSSKGTKQLREWLSSSYCKRKNISEATVRER